VTECKPVWIIVGGQRRLGRAVAEDLTRDHDLVITSSKPWDNQDWAAGQRTFVWDAENPDLVSTMEKDLDNLTFEGAVIVAGTFPEAPLGKWRSEDLERAWAVNLSFPMLVIQALAGRFAEGACLQLVLDASIHRPYLKRLPYSASKSALAALVPGFAKLLAPKVRVVGHAIGTLMPAEGMDPGALARQGMLDRTGSPEDLSRAIRFAAESPYLTGEILTQDGGRRWV
jgi:NAD(P)-dependent dehydrogenase (short-subunit alcohol dehydrogenase family)